MCDPSYVSLSVCQEAMEESQLPYVLPTLMETVPETLYIYYTEISIQMTLVSMKAGKKVIPLPSCKSFNKI